MKIEPLPSISDLVVGSAMDGSGSIFMFAQHWQRCHDLLRETLLDVEQAVNSQIYRPGAGDSCQ